SSDVCASDLEATPDEPGGASTTPAPAHSGPLLYWSLHRQPQNTNRDQENTMNALSRLLVLSAAAFPLHGIAQTDIVAILEDPARPQEDREIDATRAPADVLAFFDIGAGDHVADLLA